MNIGEGKRTTGYTISDYPWRRGGGHEALLKQRGAHEKLDKLGHKKPKRGRWGSPSGRKS